MDYDSFLELVKKRRSIKDFKNDAIPDDCIDKIIEAARWAPTGFNSQPWEFVVVKKQELKESIENFIHDAKAQSPSKESSSSPTPEMPTTRAKVVYSNAPVFILLCGDTRVREWGRPRLKANEDRWKSVLTSSLANGFLYMHLAARTVGLASKWYSRVSQPEVASQIKQLLGIPEAMEIYDMMVLGYPATEPGPKRMRDREEMVHYDDCGEEDFRTYEEVKRYFN